jgi:menaquinone C8-methyltransferase
MLSEKILTSILHVITRDTFKLNRTSLSSLPKPKEGRQYMLYLHVPFCDSLCPYCSFNRFVYNEPAARTYFKDLRAEMQQVAALGYPFQSLYIGGGTPTILLDELIRTIDLAKELFGIKEVSCETNPNQLEPTLAEQLGGRVQRLSVGVQSFNDELLKKINRFSRFGSGQDILKRIHSVEGLFQSLNIDLIFNFPGQSPEVLEQDIQAACSSGANQVTFYPLMSSPSVVTSLSKTVGTVTYDHEYDDYQSINSKMLQDYDCSTSWTFSKKNGGLIDEYIVDSEEYVGLGSGAFSYLDGTLYVNTFSLNAYSEAIEAQRSPVMAYKSYGKHNQMRYRFLMDLFGLKLDRKQFRDRFGIPVELGLPLEITYLFINGGLDLSDPAAIRLTPKGQYLFVVMMREFFIGINKVRDQARQALTAKDGGNMTVCTPEQNC